MFKSSKPLTFIFKLKKVVIHSEGHEWLSRKTLMDRAKIAIYDRGRQLPRAYLRLTFSHSKSQGRGHAHFDWELLVIS